MTTESVIVESLEVEKTDAVKMLKAVVQALECDIEDVAIEPYEVLGLPVFSGNGMEFIVCTDEEATEASNQYIKESLWCFNPSFILSHSKVPYSDKLHKALVKLQNDLCEDAQPLIEALIKDMDHFCKDAINSDGRGMCLSSYDGEEVEIVIDGTYFYAYRIN